MKKYQNKLINKILLLIVLLFVFSSLFFGGVGGKAHAAVAFDYSSVMEDLQSDLNFNAENYPIIENDNSLQVIQIAESVNGELFVYVYQPAARKDIKASSINIAREMDNSAGLGFKNYNLVLDLSLYFKDRDPGLCFIKRQESLLVISLGSHSKSLFTFQNT